MANHEAGDRGKPEGRDRASGQEQGRSVEGHGQPRGFHSFPPSALGQRVPLAEPAGRPGVGNVDAVCRASLRAQSTVERGRGGSRGTGGDAGTDSERMSEAGIQCVA